MVSYVCTYYCQFANSQLKGSTTDFFKINHFIPIYCYSYNAHFLTLFINKIRKLQSCSIYHIKYNTNLISKILSSRLKRTVHSQPLHHHPNHHHPCTTEPAAPCCMAALWRCHHYHHHLRRHHHYHHHNYHHPCTIVSTAPCCIAALWHCHRHHLRRCHHHHHVC